MSASLVLYMRQGCHLCDVFVEELRVYSQSLFDKVQVVDIDDSEAHYQAYNDKVPVLYFGETEVCRYFFDPARIKSCLKL